MFKNPNYKSTKNSLLSPSEPLPETFDRSTSVFVESLTVGFPTSVMESLWSGEGLIRERWGCARDWWMIAAQACRRETLNLVILPYHGIPRHHGYVLVTDNRINNRNDQITGKVYENTMPGISKHIP